MNKILRDTCKIGQEEKTCRYIAWTNDGFCCAKLMPEFRSIIDERAGMQWLGDNCDGVEDYHLLNTDMNTPEIDAILKKGTKVF